MRTTTATTESTLDLTIQYPDPVIFIHSPQPLLVTFSDDGLDHRVSVTVKNAETGESYTETHQAHAGLAEFDISRMVQLVSRDPSDLGKTLTYEDTPVSFADEIQLSVAYEEAWGYSDRVLNEYIWAMHGALDAAEEYGRNGQSLRLWLNLPQTFNIYQNQNDEAFIKLGFDEYIGEYEISLDLYDIIAGQAGRGYECNVMAYLNDDQKALLQRLSRGGHRGIAAQMSWEWRVTEGNAQQQSTRELTLIPDSRTEKDGTYLRWLNRRGEMSYYLFLNGEQRVASSVAEAFSRPQTGSVTTPTNGCFDNPYRASYNETREMTVMAKDLDLSDFDYLCDLATSPAVDRLLSVSPLRWERVQVLPGTYARNIRRRTPNLQDLEFTIQLPQRNTVKL